jgi:hypothetical protein
MIYHGIGIPSQVISEDIYYNNNKSDKPTKGLRDFHNLYVKKKLILSVSRRGNTLIDYACGKGGDFPKWISGNLEFVFGIDYSKDNIENRKDGACARYLNYKSENKQTPFALFVNGDSSLNIRNGEAILNEKDKLITKSVFGSINMNKDLGPAVERQHGKAINGFNISSCQFAIHYMFKNKNTFYNFIKNVADCTKVNGYFIGTCYDGKTIFDLLKRKPMGDGVSSYLNENKIWSITKNYDTDRLNDDVDSLGKEILVYQESINKTIPEYLVNFKFLNNEMEKFGFKLVSRNDAQTLKMPNGTGMFDELYNRMMDEVARYPDNAVDYKDAVNMKPYEKDISFLNRYFIFKKNMEMNTEILIKTILEHAPDEMRYEYIESQSAQKAAENGAKIEKAKENNQKIPKSKIKKLDSRLTLQEATEVKTNDLPPVLPPQRETEIDENFVVDFDIPVVKPKKVKKVKTKEIIKNPDEI